MMKQFFVQYWTKSGQIVGMTISAYTSLHAKQYMEQLPDFRSMVKYPTEV